MGAWGAGTFENDTAADWIADVGDAEDVRAALLRAVEADDYVEAPDGCEALAAAELVAAARGNPLPGEEEVAGLAARLPELAGDADLALRAVAAVASTETSELYDLWDEADPEEWLATVEDLRRRLS